MGFNPFDLLSAPLCDGFPLRLHSDVWCARFLVGLLHPLRPDDPVTFEDLAHSWRCLGRGAGVASIAAGTGSRLVCLNPAITHQQQSKAQGKNFARRHSEPTRLSLVKKEISQLNTFPDVFVFNSALVESSSVESGYRLSVSRWRDDFCVTGLHLF